LKLILEATEYGIEDSVSGQCVIIIEVVVFSCLSTWSDSKVMRLVPKKSFILFIHQLKCGHLQSTSLVPVHTFSNGSIPGTHFVGCSLRPALHTSGCFLLTQNGVFSLSILLFEIKISRRVQDQVRKEAAASP
jgi:hypothetical protein